MTPLQQALQRHRDLEDKVIGDIREAGVIFRNGPQEPGPRRFYIWLEQCRHADLLLQSDMQKLDALCLEAAQLIEKGLEEGGDA